MANVKGSLPPDTKLDNYIIRRTLAGGGFSIVYLATDATSGHEVILKEYMPSKLADRAGDGAVRPLSDDTAARFRSGRSLFFQEANTLAKVKHPNIVNVTSFFRANDTVYMVMDYEEGKNLQHYITRRGGRLSEQFLLTVFPPLLEGLQVIHAAGFLHLDIKPGNIHLRPGGRPLLLDFGAVHERLSSRQHRMGQVVSPGFSPVEQYRADGYVGPWSDIYAIGTTMRTCIEGKPPPEAPRRYDRDDLRPAAVVYRRDYSAQLLEAIDWAMEVDPLLRPQSVADFVRALPSPEPQPEPELEPAAPTLFARLTGRARG